MALLRQCLQDLRLRRREWDAADWAQWPRTLGAAVAPRNVDRVGALQRAALPGLGASTNATAAARARRTDVHRPRG
jgi:hypothetical protein